jgi:hypothetical protein
MRTATRNTIIACGIWLAILGLYVGYDVYDRSEAGREARVQRIEKHIAAKQIECREEIERGRRNIQLLRAGYGPDHLE